MSVPKNVSACGIVCERVVDCVEMVVDGAAVKNLRKRYFTRFCSQKNVFVANDWDGGRVPEVVLYCRRLVQRLVLYRLSFCWSKHAKKARGFHSARKILTDEFFFKIFMKKI